MVHMKKRAALIQPEVMGVKRAMRATTEPPIAVRRAWGKRFGGGGAGNGIGGEG